MRMSAREHLLRTWSTSIVRESPPQFKRIFVFDVLSTGERMLEKKITPFRIGYREIGLSQDDDTIREFQLMYESFQS